LGLLENDIPSTCAAAQKSLMVMDGLGRINGLCPSLPVETNVSSTSMENVNEPSVSFKLKNESIRLVATIDAYCAGNRGFVQEIPELPTIKRKLLV
jgi:hypothetical protein